MTSRNRYSKYDKGLSKLEFIAKNPITKMKLFRPVIKQSFKTQ